MLTNKFSLNIGMKKFLDALRVIFSNSSTDEQSLVIYISPSLAKRLQQIRTNTGCKDLRHLMQAMFAYNDWIYRMLEQGHIIVAIDPISNEYRQLTVRTGFPSLQKTSEQELDGDVFFEQSDTYGIGDKTHQTINLMVKETGLQSKDVISLAIRHYDWCREQVKKGHMVGSRLDNVFEESPVFREK